MSFDIFIDSNDGKTTSKSGLALNGITMAGMPCQKKKKKKKKRRQT